MTNANERYLVTGGAGFIGSHLVRHLVKSDCNVLCFDKLGYAGHRFTLDDLSDNPLLEWCIADLLDEAAIQRAIRQFSPTAIFHLAAESHVDRSIEGPLVFAKNNTIGTIQLLDACRMYRDELSEFNRNRFRIVYLSTDEVFGSLDSDDDELFVEDSNYHPNSPYSASKAAADHFANAYRQTYGLPIATVHASNNYGPFQHPEKLIPKAIHCAIDGEPIPLYGDGHHVRDWLHVDDHVRALASLMRASDQSFRDYVVGGRSPVSNREILETICSIMDELRPLPSTDQHRSLIKLVKDRPGHDRKYAVNPSLIESKLEWRPQVDLHTGLKQLVEWQLANQAWVRRVKERKFD